MVKKILIITVLILALGAVSGCFQYEIGTELKMNGSGIRTIDIGIESKSIPAIIRETIPTKVDIRLYKKDKLEHYQVIIPFDDIENEKALQFKQDSNEKPKISFTKLERIFYVDYILKETVDLSYQLNFQEELPLNLSKTKEIKTKARYRLKMPGLISEANTKDIQGDVGVWNLRFGETHHIKVVSRVYRWSVILVALLFVITFFVFIGVVYVYLRSA